MTIPPHLSTASPPPSARPGAGPRALVGGLLVALGASGCHSPQSRVESADREVYAILEDRRAAFTVQASAFTIEPATESLRARLLLAGDDAQPVELDLMTALAVAAENNREYQRRKEQLYLAALDLTLERWRFQVQESGQLGALLSGTGDDADAELSGGFGLTKLLGSGALIVGDIGLSLFRSLSTGDSFDPVSTVGLSITQPLMRGFGARIVREPLTQAERDVVYEVRDFERYRRTFGVDVTARYLRLVQQLDAIENQRANVEGVTVLREYNEAHAEAARQTEIEVDQARDNELSSRDSLLQAEQTYQALLDDFKLFLGLPVQSRVVPAADVLERLREQEPQPLELDDPDLLAGFALESRLDHLTVLDVHDDALRRLDLAEDDLRSALDLSASADVASDPGHPLSLDADDIDWQAGIELDLALNRLPQRNAYRSALINVEATRRATEESADRIRIELRDAVRESQRTVETWKLQRNAVTLNERAVESTQLNLEAGRAETRDILDAQRALLQARNAATAALIDQRLAVLALWRDLEVLRLDEEGLHPDEELVRILEAQTP